MSESSNPWRGVPDEDASKAVWVLVSAEQLSFEVERCFTSALSEWLDAEFMQCGEETTEADPEEDR